MRVAALADIHGNLPALEAVLSDVETAGVDAIVLNGDVADVLGPRVELRRTVYDAEAAAAELLAAAPDLPGVDFVVRNTRTSTSDADALTAFTATVEVQERSRYDRSRTSALA